MTCASHECNARQPASQQCLVVEEAVAVVLLFWSPSRLANGHPPHGRVHRAPRPLRPPAQEPLEVQYREVLASSHGIAFSHLLTITNMPIQRFARDLQHQGQLEPYQRVLREAHRPDNLNAVMCRSLISVSWTGALYDCDFNQQLNLASGSGPRQLADLLRVADGLIDQPIAVADHCFGCTAGSGSSCGGSLS